jgi:hypothetical protein
VKRTAAFLVLALGVTACGDADDAAVDAPGGGASLNISVPAAASTPPPTSTSVPTATTGPPPTTDRRATSVPAEATSTSAPADTPTTTVAVQDTSTSAPKGPSTSAPADTLSTDEIAFMLAGAFGRLLQRNALSGVGPALDAVLAQPLPSDVTIDHPLDGPQPLDEFLETMRRRVDEGNFGQPPPAAVRGEVLVMYDAGLLPGLPAMVADGVHKVNEDMPPGLYVIWDVAECSWERRDSDGDVVANNFIRLAGRAEVDIRPSDHEFSSENRGRWIKLD